MPHRPAAVELQHERDVLEEQPVGPPRRRRTSRKTWSTSPLCWPRIPVVVPAWDRSWHGKPAATRSTRGVSAACGCRCAGGRPGIAPLEHRHRAGVDLAEQLGLHARGGEAALDAADPGEQSTAVRPLISPPPSDHPCAVGAQAGGCCRGRIRKGCDRPLERRSPAGVEMSGDAVGGRGGCSRSHTTTSRQPAASSWRPVSASRSALLASFSPTSAGWP